MLALIPKPYFALIAVIAICALTGGAFVTGLGVGAKAEAAKWQADKIKDQQRVAQQAEAQRERIAKLESERNDNMIKGGDDIEQIRTIQAPARLEIQRQIVERPIYRDAKCRVDDSMLQLVNDARAGRSVRTEALPVVEDSVSRNTPARF